MKITIINGSPRKNGATFKVLNHFKDLLENNNFDISVNFVNLMDYNIKYCIGCQHCYKTGKCIILDDGVEEIHNIIKNSNGIIWGSPNYATNISGLLRNFHDRVHMTMEQMLYRKPCINIVTYENINIMANKVLNIMKEMVTHAGGYNINSIAIKNSFNQDPLNNKMKWKIDRLAKKLIIKIQKNKPPLFTIIFSKIVIKMFLKPFVDKNKEQYKGILNSWKEKGIIK